MLSLLATVLLPTNNQKAVNELMLFLKILPVHSTRHELIVQTAQQVEFLK
jgi:hypothetical protein